MKNSIKKVFSAINVEQIIIVKDINNWAKKMSFTNSKRQ